MDRNLARRNVRTGLIVTAVCFFMFGMTFVAAAIYVAWVLAIQRVIRPRTLVLAMSPLDPDVPPAGEEIHLPGPSIQPLLLTVGITVRAPRRHDVLPARHRGRDPVGLGDHRAGRAARAARSTSCRSST